MKNNLRKLNLMVALGVIKLDWFYCVTVYPYEIVLQGNFNSDILKNLNPMFQFVVDDNFVVARSKGVKIILT